MGCEAGDSREFRWPICIEQLPPGQLWAEGWKRRVFGFRKFRGRKRFEDMPPEAWTTLSDPWVRASGSSVKAGETIGDFELKLPEK